MGSAPASLRGESQVPSRLQLSKHVLWWAGACAVWSRKVRWLLLNCESPAVSIVGCCAPLAKP